MFQQTRRELPDTDGPALESRFPFCWILKVLRESLGSAQIFQSASCWSCRGRLRRNFFPHFPSLCLQPCCDTDRTKGRLDLLEHSLHLCSDVGSINRTVMQSFATAFSQTSRDCSLQVLLLPPGPGHPVSVAMFKQGDTQLTTRACGGLGEQHPHLFHQHFAESEFRAIFLKASNPNA